MASAKVHDGGGAAFSSGSDPPGTLGRVDVGEARDLGWMFLHRDRQRWAHVEGVAVRAEELRPAAPDADGDLLVAAAWLHDIGYSPVLDETGFHPLDGAVYLESTGHRRLAELVAHHSGSRFVADFLGLRGQLARYSFVEDALSDALTYADQTVGAAERRTPRPEPDDESSPYRRIARDLLGAIEYGALGEGEPLPALKALAKVRRRIQHRPTCRRTPRRR